MTAHTPGPWTAEWDGVISIMTGDASQSIAWLEVDSRESETVSEVGMR